jgi:hypothetical protein
MAMAGKGKTPERANGDMRSESFGFGGKLNMRDLASVAAVLGPHAFAIVGIVASANWAVVGGANPYLAYGFARWGIISYMVLALKTGRK